MKRDAEKNKRDLISAMEKHLGIVSMACREAKISRETFYKYYREDDEFKKEIDSINEMTLDFVETQLLRKIKEGSERSILFYMRYKGKTRGYTDSVDITSDGEKINEIKLIEVKRNESS